MGWFKKADAQGRTSLPASSPQPKGRTAVPKSPQPSQPSGPISMESKVWRSVATHSQRAADNSERAVSMLVDIMQPQDRESPDRIQEILDGQAAILESQAELKQQNTEILSLLRRMVPA